MVFLDQQKINHLKLKKELDIVSKVEMMISNFMIFFKLKIWTFFHYKQVIILYTKIQFDIWSILVFLESAFVKINLKNTIFLEKVTHYRKENKK